MSALKKVDIASSIKCGAEVFGLNGPDVDAEMIMMTARLWRELGIADHVRLELNSIGLIGRSEQVIVTALVTYLEQYD